MKYVCRVCDIAFQSDKPATVWTGNVCEYVCSDCEDND